MQRKTKMIFTAALAIGFGIQTYLFKSFGYHFPSLAALIATIMSSVSFLFFLESIVNERHLKKLEIERAFEAIEDLNRLMGGTHGAIVPTGTCRFGTRESWKRIPFKPGMHFILDLERKQVLVSEDGNGIYEPIRTDPDSDIIQIVKGFRDSYPTLSVAFTDNGGIKVIDDGFLYMHEDWLYTWPDRKMADLGSYSDYVRVTLKNILIDNLPTVDIPSSEAELRFTAADTAWLSDTRGTMPSLKVFSDIKSVEIFSSGQPLYKLIPTQEGFPSAFRRVALTN